MAAAVDGPRGALMLAAKTERLLLNTYSIDLPPHQEKTVRGPVDLVSAEILRQYCTGVLDLYTPVKIYGDGNCLYRAISQGMHGHQKNHMMVRLLTVLEIVENRLYYDSRDRRYIDIVKDNRVVSDDYQSLLKDAVTLGRYAEMLHVYAASAAIGLAMESYCPHLVKANFLSEPYTRTVCGRRVGRKAIPAFTLLWTQCTVPANQRLFRPNHFALLHDKDPPAEDHVDLTSPGPVPLQTSNRNTRNARIPVEPTCPSPQTQPVLDLSQDTEHAEWPTLEESSRASPPLPPKSAPGPATRASRKRPASTSAHPAKAAKKDNRQPPAKSVRTSKRRRQTPAGAKKSQRTSLEPVAESTRLSSIGLPDSEAEQEPVTVDEDQVNCVLGI